MAGQLQRSFSSRWRGISRPRVLVLTQGRVMPSNLAAMEAVGDFRHSVQGAPNDRYVIKFCLM
eukprot:COSAG02_NODE_614_length_19515_cov_6.651937_9_plen_63_part_00